MKNVFHHRPTELICISLVLHHRNPQVDFEQHFLSFHLLKLRLFLILSHFLPYLSDVSFSCVVKTQRRWSKKIYETELTKKRYDNQVLGKYQVDPQRVGLTFIAELTWSNLG